MVKIRIISLSILLLILFIDCQVASTKDNGNYYRIGEYVDFKMELSQDTVVFGDTVCVTVIFKNKTDTCFYFYPDALLFIDRYVPPHIFLAGENIIACYLNESINIDNMVLLESHKTYIKTYQVVVKNPLVRFG
jgi:hypothetical protein